MADDAENRRYFSQQELRFDAAKLFRHCQVNLGDDMSIPMEWSFYFRHDECAPLEALCDPIAEALSKAVVDRLTECDMEVAERVIQVNPGGKESYGRPLLTLSFTNVLSVDELARCHKSFAAIAVAANIEYEGVDVADSWDGTGWERVDP